MRKKITDKMRLDWLSDPSRVLISVPSAVKDGMRRTLWPFYSDELSLRQAIDAAMTASKRGDR